MIFLRIGIFVRRPYKWSFSAKKLIRNVLGVLTKVDFIALKRPLAVAILSVETK